MLKNLTRGFMALVVSVYWSACSHGLRVPNRGTQLFILIEERGSYSKIVAITEPERYVVQQWHSDKGTYDFIAAVTSRSKEGCKLSFTRYVMAEDYLPRIEHLDLAFPYSQQPTYRFFNYGSITGFYRNSVDDFSPNEFLPRHI